MKTLLKSLVLLVTVIVVLFGGLAVFVGTLNADKYRPQLVEVLKQKTGRTVGLDGAIGFSLRPSGVQVSIQDASISNPAWASRPHMAKMHAFKVKVDLLPLLSKKLEINELVIENADILMETNKAGEHNWDFGGTEKKAQPEPAAPTQTSATPKASLSIDKLSILNSQLAMRGADGKTSSVNVGSLTLEMQKAGVVLQFKGDVNGAPLALNVKTSITDLLGKAPFSFDTDLTYQAQHLTAQGKADIAEGKANISAYEVVTGKTSVKGNAVATWSGARPSLRGEMNSDHIDLADFAAKTTATKTEQPAAAPTNDATPEGNKRLFSTDPLPLAALKAADADLTLSVKEFVMGTGSLQNISAKLTLSGGNLTLAPVKASVGAAPVDVQLKLNAAQSPAQVTAGIIATGVDLGDLQKLGGMAPFMTGKADANIQLTGTGNSAHDIASSLGGVIVITAEKGEILTGAAAKISSALAAVFNPAGGNAALNCLAARFIVKNGLMKDNGILIDTSPSTIVGQGSVNLDSETPDLILRAKTKLVDIGSLIPPLEIGGSLSQPSYKTDTTGAVQNVVGVLSSGNLSTLGSSGIPVLQAAPSGQNACIYTLDHPQQAAGSNVLPADALGKAKQNIQNLGGSLMNGLFGK